MRNGLSYTEKKITFVPFEIFCFLLFLISSDSFLEGFSLVFFFLITFPKIVLESRYGSKPGKKWTLAVNYTVIV